MLAALDQAKTFLRAAADRARPSWYAPIAKRSECPAVRIRGSQNRSGARTCHFGLYSSAAPNLSFSHHRNPARSCLPSMITKRVAILFRVFYQCGALRFRKSMLSLSNQRYAATVSLQPRPAFGMIAIGSNANHYINTLARLFRRASPKSRWSNSTVLSLSIR